MMALVGRLPVRLPKPSPFFCTRLSEASIHTRTYRCTLYQLSARTFSAGHCLRNGSEGVTSSISKPSRLRLFVRFLAIGVFFTTAGFTLAALPALRTAASYLNPPTDAETLLLFRPEDESSREIDEFIKNHPLALEMRSKPDFVESRPHLKIPGLQRGHSLTSGTLLGPRRIAVPPLVFSEDGGKSLVSITYLGTDLCGHPNLIHGGLLATLLDEGFAKCCFPALPNKVGMTANLNVNYRRPAPAGAYFVLRAKTVRVEGRKAWVEGHIETLAAEGETPIVIVEASALFIEPRKAAAMARVYPVS